ncbi:MAG: ACT domain-containing protein [Candidatus ainarchaeum sp.]|nr:ACT domain-containing protein [Candidatus ainarchaeum sp.]
MAEKTSELVWLHVKRRPFLKEMLRGRLANYSALARKISVEAFGTKKRQNAVKMALVRLAGKIRQREEDLEGRILSVIGKSSLSVRNKVAVVIATRELPGLKYLSYVESRGVITYIVAEKDLDAVGRPGGAIRIERNLNLISIHSPPSVEQTPGVMAYLLDALSGEGINIEEFVSCYTDTLFVVRQADTARAYEILSGMMG